MTWPLPNDTDEYYGMPFFAGIETDNLETSAQWYHALGFRHIFTIPGPGGRAALVPRPRQESTVAVGYGTIRVTGTDATSSPVKNAPIASDAPSATKSRPATTGRKR